MPAVSAIIEELIDGAGYIRLPNVMSAPDAAEARTRALEIAASPSAATLGRRHERTGQQHIHGLLAHGELFERLVQHPKIIEIAEELLGDDMTLKAYSCRVKMSGATEMGVHVDYPYWAMGGPFAVRPALMLQVIWISRISPRTMAPRWWRRAASYWQRVPIRSASDAKRSSSPDRLGPRC